MRIASILLTLTCASALGAPVDMGLGVVGSEPVNVVPVVGTWTVQQDGATKVLAVDGGQWHEGTASKRLDEVAAALFAADAKAFAEATRRHASFPLAIVRNVPAFANGSVTVRFKPLAGREDQAAGIAFAIESNGNYLILRANALEDNLVLFQFKKGRRSALKEVGSVPTKSGQWHELRLVVDGSKVKGSVDGKLYLEHDVRDLGSGRVGLWSKADSVVQFTGLDVVSGR